MENQMNIVIIDNDRAILRSLELMLAADGHEVITFSDPRQALFHFVKDRSTDALLLDYSMPEMNGDELIQRLTPELPSSCKIIMMTAHSDVIERMNVQALGVHVLIKKPIRYIDLTNALYAPNQHK
jgi:DNA-binding response OmpR family regulator